MIYFPQAYAGMSVALDYSYSVPQNGSSSPKVYTVYGEVHRISDAVDSTYGLCYIELAGWGPGGAPIGLNALYQSVMPTGWSVSIMPDAQGNGQPSWSPTDGVTQRVHGISLGTRAVRKDTGAFHGSQWRISSMETSLQVVQ